MAHLVEGWKNAETWAVWMTISNDSETYFAAVRMAKEVLAESGGTSPTDCLASRLEYKWGDPAGNIARRMPNVVLRDMFVNVYEEVDWVELAEELLDKAKEAN